MYFTNITNKELEQFHGLTVPNFTIKLTDLLTSGLFKVETIVNDSIYRIYPLFYCNEITSTNPVDKILENRCIICRKENKETYLTFISDDGEVVDYNSNATYFNIGDTLTVNQFNTVIDLLRQHTNHTDNFTLMNGAVFGKYGVYTFDLDSTTIIDTGILVTDETLSSLGTVTLTQPIFKYSDYVLKLKVYHYTDVNISGETTSDNIVVDTLIVPLVNGVPVQIPFSTLDYSYVVGLDAVVEITHTKPVIPDWINLINIKAEPNIIQTGDTTDIYAECYDNGGIPVRNGHEVYFYEVFTPTITLTGIPSIIQTGGTCDLTAKVKDEDGSLIDNETVYFYQPSILEGYFNNDTDFIELNTGQGSAEYTENGIVRCKGYVVDDYFENTENWEMEFTYNYASGMRYTGLICLADYDNPSTYIGSWEGGEILGLASDLPSGAIILDNPVVTDWITLHIRKTSSTTLEVWKNNDRANKVTYTWNDLSSISRLTIGGRTNTLNVVTSNQFGSIYIKNWRVKQ